MTATGKLVSFVCQLDPDTLPAATLDQAVRCVLDLTGVAIAGAPTPMAAISARFAHEQFAPGNATVIGSGKPLSVVGATWVNGAYASALDMDDGHRTAMGHPGASVIPAALAVAERTGAAARNSSPQWWRVTKWPCGPVSRAFPGTRTRCTRPASGASSARRPPPASCSGSTRARSSRRSALPVRTARFRPADCRRITRWSRRRSRGAA